MWKWSRRWEDWYRRALPAYWIFLFCSTHLPRPRIPGPVPWWDKVIHTIVFGMLAFLLWRFIESFERPPTATLVWKCLAILAAYAAFDEYLQQFVGRSTSFTDWIADMIGIVAVLIVLEVRRRAATRRNSNARFILTLAAEIDA